MKTLAFIIFTVLIFACVILGLAFKNTREVKKQDFLNSLLYMYPESYDSSDGVINVQIADETVYEIHVNSAENDQNVSTINPELFRRAVDQLQENHINVSLSKNRGIYSVNWSKILFVPDLREEESVIIVLLIKHRKIKEAEGII